MGEGGRPGRMNGWALEGFNQALVDIIAPALCAPSQPKAFTPFQPQDMCETIDTEMNGSPAN